MCDGEPRVLIASPSGNGAVATMFRVITRELSTRGACVTTLAQGRTLDEPSPHEHHLTWPSPRPTRPVDAVVAWRQLNGVDVAIANFGAVNFVTLAAWARRVPIRICWVRTLSSQIALDRGRRESLLDRLRMMRKRWVYARATHVIANSRITADDVVQVFRVPPEKVLVVPNMMRRASNGKQHRAEAPTIHVLCVGRLAHSKGQDVLIRALGMLSKAGGTRIRAEFIGDGPERQALEALAIELGVAQRCKFLGSQSREAVLAAMASAAAVVVPSRKEAFGWVSIEAMSTGTPVVGTLGTGTEEIVTHNHDGLLIPADDAAALASALEAISDTNLRERLGSNALATFDERYELEKGAARFTSTLLAMIAELGNKD